MIPFLKNTISLALIAFSFISSYAQDVPKNIVVEHFTNTRCGICASRNPGFYTALNQNPNVIHIAYHPSSPYSNCLFSTQNKVQNDARTNYYDVYGGTPIFVINGVEKNGGQVQSSTVYNEFKNQTTPVDLKVAVSKFGSDQIEVSFDVKAMSNNTIGNVNYFVALVEDTVLYNAPNGEKVHRDVFRKSLSNNVTLPSFSIPANEGNTYEFKDKIKIESIWNPSKIYAIVILTDSNKKVVQVAKSTLYNPNVVSSTENESELTNSFEIYPNPASSEILIKNNKIDFINQISILNPMGQEIFKSKTVVDLRQPIDITNLEAGTYYLQIETIEKVMVQKFIKL